MTREEFELLAGHCDDCGDPIDYCLCGVLFERVTAEEFATAYETAWLTVPNLRAAGNETYKEASTLGDWSARCYLATDGHSGFALLNSDGTGQHELVAVFATRPRRGDHLLDTAIANGARRLDCFDGYLVDFYGRHGFIETGRAANWTHGEPDVVFMELPFQVGPTS